MAGTSLLTLIDDIATLLDDVAVLTKVATRKTAGVLGDDLALNAEQVTGVKVDRELPVVWAVAKGSALNKLILVPAGLAISAVAPWAIMPLLMLGGAFLCFEGFEKVFHKLFHAKEEEEHKAQLKQAVADPAVDLVAFEKDKIKGAVRTDFILSAEIIVISLGSMGDAAFVTRVVALAVIAALITVLVYGLVAGIVKLDDAGLWLRAKGGGLASLGNGIIAVAPWLMKALGVVGTAAMFMVGGGILVHGIPGAEAWVHHLETTTGPIAGFLLPSLINAGVGIVAGGILVALLTGVKKLLPKKTGATA